MFFLRYYFWVAPHVLLGLVLAGLIRRRLRNQYPIFLSYIVFELVQFVVLFTIHLRSGFSLQHYRVVLLASLAVGIPLKFGVVYELGTELLLSHSSLGRTLRTLLRWGSALLLLIASISSIILFGSDIQQLTRIFHVLDFSWSVILTGLLLLLLAFAEFFQISWRSYTSGITIGFGVFAAVELASAALRAQFGTENDVTVSLAQMAAYHVCVVIWLVYLFAPERSSKLMGKGLQKSELEFWDQELQRIAQR